MKLEIISSVPQPTETMISNFYDRTNHHIGLVAKNLNYIASYYRSKGEDWAYSLAEALIKRASTHDASKFSEPEYYPYIWITEFHRCKNSNIEFSYPPGVKKLADEASLHHILNNSHHPEFHDHGGEFISMGILDTIEMVCDWTAMSEELGQGNSARNWADKNVGKKWNFCDFTTDLIYKTIDTLERVKAEM